MIIPPPDYQPDEELSKLQKYGPTAALCVATALATVFATRTIDVRLAKKFAYGKGFDFGAATAMLENYEQFLDAKDLESEFMDFLYERNKDFINIPD